MTDTVATIIGAVVSSQALFSFLTIVVTRILDRRSAARKTIEAISYMMLSDKIEQHLDADYATPEQRRELDILYDAYKANGWNGDMDARMKKIYDLPTKKIEK